MTRVDPSEVRSHGSNFGRAFPYVYFTVCFLGAGKHVRSRSSAASPMFLFMNESASCELLPTRRLVKRNRACSNAPTNFKFSRTFLAPFGTLALEILASIRSNRRGMTRIPRPRDFFPNRKRFRNLLTFAKKCLANSSGPSRECLERGGNLDSSCFLPGQGSVEQSNSFRFIIEKKKLCGVFDYF